MRRRRMLAGIGLAAVLVACGTERPGETTEEPSDVPMPPFGSTVDFAVPSLRAVDWVTYGDHLVVGTVAAEQELHGELSEEGAGLIGRLVTVEITHVRWSRPGAPELPAQVELELPGWTRSGDGDRTQISDLPWPEVGHTYVIGLARFDDWALMGPGAIVNYDNGLLGADGPYAADRYPPVVQDAWAQPVDALADRLRLTEPDPAAAEFMDKPPLARMRAVIEARKNGAN